MEVNLSGASSRERTITSNRSHLVAAEAAFPRKNQEYLPYMEYGEKKALHNEEGNDNVSFVRLSFAGRGVVNERSLAGIILSTAR